MTVVETQKRVGSAMVIGGGIAGMEAALTLADSGIKVFLVEHKPSIGGKMSQLDKTFPTNDCAMCTMAPRLVSISRHKDIELIMLSDIEDVSGVPGRFSVRLNRRSRYVNEEKCTGCGLCVSHCPIRQKPNPQDLLPPPLTPEERITVTEILMKHKDTQGPLMPILRDINASFNYLPPNVLVHVSLETGIPLTHIYRIATFYNAFSTVPRGKHIVNICIGTTCYVRGSNRILEKLKSELGIREGETTRDMMFTLNPVRCLGCCGLAPAVMIDDTVHGNVTPKDIPEILKRSEAA